MSSWEFKKNISQMGKWNKIFLSITCFWALMILTGPLILEPGETGDLSGSVGLYDNKKVIQEMIKGQKVSLESSGLSKREWNELMTSFGFSDKIL